MVNSVVIGSGFSGLVSASLLAQRGQGVTLLEKNDSIGGRARQFSAQGYTFDMGPSWYWMSDVYDRFFSYFGKTSHDFYELIRLDPGFRIFFPDQTLDIPGKSEDLPDFFNQVEKGSADAFSKFMKLAKEKYDIGVLDIIYRQPDGLKPFMNWKTVSSVHKIQLFSSIREHIAKYFKNPLLRQLLEFPVLFLGADPSRTPALYSLMAYSGLIQGTWYPKGGFGVVVKAFEKIANDHGVQIKTNQEVQSIDTSGKYCSQVKTKSDEFTTDHLVISADYHHFDQKVFHPSDRQYSQNYWEKRTMAPSTLLYYLGHKGKVPNLLHHNLFFDTDFDAHSDEIYETKKWPEDPLFYVCVPSKTDETVAPSGHENIFILIPVASGLEETKDIQEKYFQLAMDRIQQKIGFDIRPGIDYCRYYATTDFMKDYNAFCGNAYGLANTLDQTAFLKPRMKNKKLENVYYCGHLTVPGPGVPPAIVSGELAANYIKPPDHLKYA